MLQRTTCWVCVTDFVTETKNVCYSFFLFDFDSVFIEAGDSETKEG